MDKESRAKDLIKLAERYRSRKLGNARRRLNFGGDENFSISRYFRQDIMDQRSELVAQKAQELEDKYNFDFIEEKPKKGDLDWETIEVTDVAKSKDVPDFYFRPPHVKRPAFRRIDVLPNATISRDPLNLNRQQEPQESTTIFPSNTITTTSRQVFLDSARAETITSPLEKKSSLSGKQQCLVGEDDIYSGSNSIVTTATKTITSSSTYSPLSNNDNSSSPLSLAIKDNDNIQDCIHLSNEAIASSHSAVESHVALNPDHFSIINNQQSNQNQESSETEESQETPSMHLNGGTKRTQVSDYYPQKKKCLAKVVKRKLYETDDK